MVVNIVFVIVFMLLGILFFLLEIFFLPGITFGAIAGTFFTIASVWIAFAKLGPMGGVITLLGGMILMALAIWMFMKTKTLDKMALHTKIESKVDDSEKQDVKVGDRGISISRLAAYGKIKINDKVMEARSADGFIDAGANVEVVDIDNHEIVVQVVA